MKILRYSLLITCAFFLMGFGIFAQDKMIHGIITTLDSIPLDGASIKVLSSKQVFLTDSLGNFTAQCNKEDKLRITAEGFYSQRVKLKDNIKFVAVNLKLKPGEKNREYAIGYGVVTDANKSNAVDGFDTYGEDLLKYSSVLELIRDRFSGVQIRNGEIIIRGTNSFNSSSAALIVIDGSIVDQGYLNSIRPIEVKSINVIKDGSSAVYGSRGANGVVIIETKKGGDI